MSFGLDGARKQSDAMQPIDLFVEAGVEEDCLGVQGGVCLDSIAGLLDDGACAAHLIDAGQRPFGCEEDAH
jgi:hypothetical protein